jgi:transketolase
MTNEITSATIKNIARRTRIDILNQIHDAGSGHPGGSMSCADILSAIYGYAVQPPADWMSRQDRDRVILSKGHAAPALYGVLAEVGLLPHEELSTLRKLGSRLQGHPDRVRLPEVEMSTGSLGQGLSVAAGLAWWYKARKLRGRIYVVLGDGEMDSGQVWEAISLAGGHKLDNLVVVLDANGIQNDGPVPEILDLRPYDAKVRPFGWSVREINGHDIEALMSALDWAKSDEPGTAPRFIIAHTVKGKGVSFMENRYQWHSHSLSEDEYRNALKEVENS